MMKTTIKDVARQAGVSIATVSRVLNGKDRVHKLTREKVRQAVEQLQFQPDYTARTMVMKETKTVGLLIPQLSNEFWATLAERVESALWDAGYTLTLCMIGGHGADKERSALRSLTDKRADGIIFCVPEGFAGGAVAAGYERLTVPGVSFEQSLPGMSSIHGDHVQGAQLAVGHLLELGHTRIACLGGPLVSTSRELGYRQAMLEQCGNVDESLVLQGEPTLAFGREAVRTLLENGTLFTAVFGANDLIALGAAEALKQAGLRVPDDISVVGYDDIAASALVTPALTTVRQPTAGMAEALVELLLERMSGTEKEMPDCKLVFPMELIVRASTAKAV